MYLPRVDFIGPDVAPAAAIAVYSNSNGRIFAVEALNSVPFEEDASRLSEICSEPEAQLHRLVTFFD
jgi:hypothetical protein